VGNSLPFLFIAGIFLEGGGEGRVKLTVCCEISVCCCIVHCGVGETSDVYDRSDIHALGSWCCVCVRQIQFSVDQDNLQAMY
jgi:hypothetical protein